MKIDSVIDVAKSHQAFYGIPLQKLRNLFKERRIYSADELWEIARSAFPDFFPNVKRTDRAKSSFCNYLESNSIVFKINGPFFCNVYSTYRFSEPQRYSLMFLKMNNLVRFTKILYLAEEFCSENKDQVFTREELLGYMKSLGVMSMKNYLQFLPRCVCKMNGSIKAFYGCPDAIKKLSKKLSEFGLVYTVKDFTSTENK